jgi:PIN domain nuclease of toxin-antitoxin system
MWYLLADPQLSERARMVLRSVVAAGDPIFVSAASAVELQYLLAKGTVTEDDFRWYMSMLESAAEAIEVTPVDLGVARAVELVPRDAVPDPFDRMIAATSVALGVPLVTCDRRLQALPAVETIW